MVLLRCQQSTGKFTQWTQPSQSKACSKHRSACNMNQSWGSPLQQNHSSRQLCGSDTATPRTSLAHRARHRMHSRQQSHTAFAVQKSVIAKDAPVRQQAAAVAPKQQTGNEHLDGKLKIIGSAHALLLYICMFWFHQCWSSQISQACQRFLIAQPHHLAEVWTMTEAGT